jgi:hypothetical protein
MRITILMKVPFLLLLWFLLPAIQSCKKEITTKGSCKLVKETVYNPVHEQDAYFKRVNGRAYDADDRLILYTTLDSVVVADDTVAEVNTYDISYDGSKVTIVDSLQLFVPLSIQLNELGLPVSTSNAGVTRWYRYNEINEIQYVTDTTNGVVNSWTITYVKGGVTEMSFAASDSSIPKQHYTFSYFTGIERPHGNIGAMVSDPRTLVDLSPPEKWAELFSRYLLQSFSSGTQQVTYNYEFDAYKFPVKRVNSRGEVVSYEYDCP